MRKPLGDEQLLHEIGLNCGFLKAILFYVVLCWCVTWSLIHLLEKHIHLNCLRSKLYEKYSNSREK
jgi:hypothetical protein